jgi:elongation factor Ts
MPITITAAMVQQLRAQTGAGIMECKQALQASGGDFAAAVAAMRESGQSHAEKKSSRIAAEGLILIKSNKAAGIALILEINCETDFVSRDENFKHFAEEVAQLALDNKIESIETLLSTEFPETGNTVESIRRKLLATLGENIQLRRLAFMYSHPGTHIGSYVHMGRIGAIVEIQGGDEQLAKDLALHIVANKPLVISLADVSDAMRAKEQEMFTTQARASGKPPAVVEKMLEERIDKFLDEAILLRQAFIKEPNRSIKELLAQSKAKVLNFIRFAVGEGIEKAVEDFAEAVRAQVKSS